MRVAAGSQRVLDADFIAQHTHGFEEFAALARARRGTTSSASRACRAPTWSTAATTLRWRQRA